MSFQYNTATSFSEETYLESFVEAVSWTLPSDLQRSLQHLQMLDNESAKLMKHWRDTQDSCLRGVEAALLGAYSSNNHDESKKSGSSIPPTTPLDSSNVSKRKSPASSERKKACYKCRNKKVKCDGKQSFCLFKEEYYNTAIANNNISEGVLGGDTADYYSPPQKKSKLMSAAAANDKQSSSTTSSATATTSAKPLPKLDMTRPPTTVELRTALQSRNPHYTHQRQTITTMYHQLQQNSREKIETANQLKSMIDMALGRLNRDREKFERDLGLVSSTSAAAAAGAGEKNANCSLNQSGIMMVGGGDAAAIATSAAITTATTTTSLAAAASAEPHSTATTTSILSNTNNKDLAAIQTTPNSPDWILAKIISYNKYTKMYTLSDEDMASNEIYTIPERQVRPLLQSKKWTKGDEIYAVYPDTTSFYPAVVNYCTRNGHDVMVHFKDDWDASGVIHEKAIPMQHVMKAP